MKIYIFSLDHLLPEYEQKTNIWILKNHLESILGIQIICIESVMTVVTNRSNW